MPGAILGRDAAKRGGEGEARKGRRAEGPRGDGAMRRQGGARRGRAWSPLQSSAGKGVMSRGGETKGVANPAIE